MTDGSGDETDVFMAISHPARRRVLDMLVRSERPVHVIADHFEMSRPAVSRHLRVLRDAGLIVERRTGRERRYRLAPERLSPVRDWIRHFEGFWDDRLDRLEAHLRKEGRA